MSTFQAEVDVLREEVERQRQVIANLERKIEQLTLCVTPFHQQKEYLFDFPAPFVAKAVEITGLVDGVKYTIQGKGDDGEWKYVFTNTCHSMEIGLYQFRNDVAYKSYRVMCMSSAPLGSPEFRLYQSSDDIRLFRKGIPPFTCPSPVQYGYEISVSSQHGIGKDYPYLLAHISYNMLDDNVKTLWAGDGGSSLWLRVKLPRPRIFNAVEIAARGDGCLEQAPREFRIEGSLDLRSWKRLLPPERDVSETVATGPWSLGERRVFAFPNEQEFMFYRLTVVYTHGAAHTALSVFNLGNIAKL